MNKFASPRRWLAAGLILGLLGASPFTAPAVLAQTAKKAAKGGDEGPPAPVDMTLQSKDGAGIYCTFYPGTLGKKAIPFILIHGWEGQRGEFKALALYLQSLGHAVIVPDLRGHGQSLHFRLANGETADFDLKRFGRADMAAMVLDIEATKRFLLEKNNEGELNIESLCVVGSEFGCILAMRWAMADWNAPVLPAFKQGQDVKALVLLSPIQSFKGLTLRDPLAHPVIRSQLSILIIAGANDSKSLNEAKRLHSSLQGFHGKLPDDPAERKLKQSLYFITPETKLVGTKLLAPGLNTAAAITEFINRRLIARQGDFPWTERRNPLGN